MLRRLTLLAVAMLAAVTLLWDAESRTAHADEPVTVTHSYQLGEGKWRQPQVDVFYNWSETVCDSPYTNASGDSTPPVPAAAATESLRIVIQDLNDALAGALVLVDAGKGPANGHCDWDGSGSIAVGWSPLHTAGVANYGWMGGPDGAAIFGAGVMIDSSSYWTEPIESCSNGDTYRLLRHVILHEVMHALGIGHSEVSEAVMAPSHNVCVATAVLHQDDLDALRAHYPPSASAPKPGTSPVAGSPPATLGSIGLAITPAETTAEGLVPILATEGCDARVIAIAVGGKMLAYIVGAPTFVNASFPTPLAASTPYVYRCAR